MDRIGRLFWLWIVAVIAVCGAEAAARQSEGDLTTVFGLRCEYKDNPLGIDVRKPRLSWKMAAERRGARQSAYRVVVARSLSDLEGETNLVWDSGRIETSASIHREYQGPSLESASRYYWKVRVWDEENRVSDWSQEASWETGLLEPSDWKADWIEADVEENVDVSQPAQLLRTVFHVDGAVARARAYVTSHGLYELELNGQRIGDQVFTPGWTSYNQRLQYQTYDVTSALRGGDNAVGVTLGDGWYRGYLAFSGKKNLYGKKLALLFQLRIEYEDGRSQHVISGDGWDSSTGPILISDIYNGEHYDARLEKPGWSSPGYDSRSWSGVRIVPHPKDTLVAPAGPPVRKIQELLPVQVLRTPAGETVYDMGQNMVGWVRLRVKGRRGQTVTLRHAEVLDSKGNFYTENLRAARQEVRYTLKGRGWEVYEPHFSFQGFRYVAVEGIKNPGLEHLTGVVIHSDLPMTGEFESSDPLINQLQHNIVWGQKGNFLDVPTDCPQRDERLGWTGDAQVFSRTAAFNMDVAGFFTKWLADLAADQFDNGSIPFVIPDVLGGAGSAAWADAGVIIPWNMYQTYGDVRLLETQYSSMKAWVDYMAEQAGDDFLWDSGFHFGDWLAFATTRSDYPGATTDKDLIATSFFAYSTSLLEQTATILGKTEEARRYQELLAQIRSSFLKEYVTANGRMASNTQTAYAVALFFDLLPADMRPLAAARLARDVRAFNNHLTTGFVGTPYLCHVLSRFGFLSVAYDLLNQKGYPSWLYPVTKGATTIWERWDGIKPDGSFQDKGMNSFNHYAYGAIGEWLYRVVAGIELDPAKPGYKHFFIQPQPGGRLTSARASLESMYGRIVSSWRLDADQRFHLEIEVPPNTSASVRLPHARADQVTESGDPLGRAAGVSEYQQAGREVRVELLSGRYLLEYPSPALATFVLSKEGASTYTRLEQLLAGADTRGVLEEMLGDLLERLARGTGRQFTLRELAAFTPSLTEELLGRIDEALGRLEK